MPDLDDVTRFLSDETGLATVSTVQADGRVLSSIVNCGVVDHPVNGERCVALVSRGGAARLAHVRRGSEVTIAVRRGWRWVGVTGPAALIGPSDAVDGVDAEGLRLLLREIYAAAGGVHDDLDEYDRAMADDGRTAVLVSPERIIGNSPS
ncbi:MAG: pyridoxamine 5'-phosphate oxidase [Actinomycetota bacterium]